MKNLIFTGIVICLFSCSARQQTVQIQLRDSHTFVLTEISSDPTYGHSPENPVKVGGIDNNEGPLNERRFLNALAGPNGESINYFREGSCCPVKSKNALIGGMALLDHYSVSWEGSKDTISIYINMYDFGELKAPVGFTIKE